MGMDLHVKGSQIYLRRDVWSKTGSPIYKIPMELEEYLGYVILASF